MRMIQRLLLLSMAILICIQESKQVQFLDSTLEGQKWSDLRKATSNKMVMTVVTINNYNGTNLPANQIYINAFDSVLYLDPSSRYYSFMTITRFMYFYNFDIDYENDAPMPSVIELEPDQTDLVNPDVLDLINSFITQTNIMSLNTTYSVCWIKSDPNRASKSSFFCFRTKDKKMYSVDVLANEHYVTVDVVINIFQLVVAIGIVYIYVTNMNIIRKSRKFIFVTDSIKNPPMWQNLFPSIPTSIAVKFRIFDSISLCVVHIILCTIVIFSQLQPEEWPALNYNFSLQFRNYLANSKQYWVAILLIIINTTFFLIKLISDNHRNLSIKVLPDVSTNKTRVKFDRIIVSLVYAAACVSILVCYVFFGVPSKRRYRRVLWCTGCVLFGIALFFNLHFMNIYADKKLTSWLQSKFSFIGKGRKEEKDDTFYQLQEELSQEYYVRDEVLPKVAAPKKDKYQKHLPYWLYLLVLIINYTIRSVWLCSLALMTFLAGFVVSRFIESTIDNILVNGDIISTYSYFFSIVGVMYKTKNDIELPYLKLKTLICNERGALSMERILHHRSEIRSRPYEEAKKDKENWYLIPMTWTVFIRVSKLMRLRRQTLRTAAQAVFAMFILCVFHFSNLIFDVQFNKVFGNSAIFAILATTVMPLIPKFISYLSEDEVGMDSKLFNARLNNAMLLLERQEERRNTLEFAVGKIPHRYARFMYKVLSALKEEKEERMDPLYDYDPLTNEATIKDPGFDHQE
ncbi:RecA [Acrasis kona]|uniref:RecA n=1 Tax=Acrasis kona TaxID=1008807 RepID=A0AAW2ZNK9_9EUKA